MKVQSDFTVAVWKEISLGEELSELPIMRVSAVFESVGDINGKFNVEYVMHYKRHDENNPHAAQARYTGYLLFSGTIKGKIGTFALEDAGVYMNSVPSSVCALWTIQVPVILPEL
jgi:hypothetical protein